MNTTQALLEEIDEAMEVLLAGRQQPCCTARCSWCCYEPCYAGQAEVQNILQQLTRGAKEQLARRVSVWMERTAPLHRQLHVNAFEWRRLEVPCPLLSEDGTCLVYPWRPFACRTFFAFGNCLDCAMPARERQTFLKLPDAFLMEVAFRFYQISNGISQVGHLGCLLSEELQRDGMLRTPSIETVAFT